MACGTPVVTTDVGDAAFIVGDTGWIVPPRDSPALARAIGEALAGLADRSQWAARQAASRKRIVENFALERMIAGYEAVWRQVMERVP
jgi:glycosyltransferase involved in cell wall biosynthesis